MAHKTFISYKCELRTKLRTITRNSNQILPNKMMK